MRIRPLNADPEGSAGSSPVASAGGSASRAAPARTLVLAAAAVLAVVIAALIIASAWRVAPGHAARHHGTKADGTTADVTGPGTAITIDGARRGPVFDGIGAISGGGGNSRLLIDYLTKHPRQAQQVLDYLFKPGYGAALQILKLEIGGDAYATDGAEPSMEHTAGAINCHAGYEFWLARQALKLNPALQIYAVQWNTPHWIGAAWSDTDIKYLLDWLHCASADHIRVAYLGGWNEHLPHGITAQVMGWFVKLRATLDQAGYGDTKLVAVDSFAHENGTDVANYLADHPAFAAAIGVLGYHDICGYPTSGRLCRVPQAAKASGKPIWATEIGALRLPGGPAALARTISNAYIQAKATAIIEYPLLSAMPGGMAEEDRGLVVASQPWTGYYQVSLIAWVIAQTTEFTEPGWLHVAGAAGSLGRNYGSYTAYEGPRRAQWSLVAQTSTARNPQTITVHVTGGLPSAGVHVWRTRLKPSDPRGWFQPRGIIPMHSGTFTDTLQPGYVYTFTTTTGQHPGPPRTAAPLTVTPQPMPMPYSTSAPGPDEAGMPWGLEPADGSFEYPKGVTSYFEQTTAGGPTFRRPLRPLARFPYAVAGDYCLGNVPVEAIPPGNPEDHVPTWCPNRSERYANYAVTATVAFTGTSQSAGVIARYYRPITSPIQYFQGYRFMVSQAGYWTVYRDENAATKTAGPRPVVIKSGKLAAPLGVRTPHTIGLTVHDNLLTASVDGSSIWSGPDPSSRPYHFGVAGIATGGWYPVQFQNMTISP
jgi:O-glycosyl hydrolase